MVQQSERVSSGGSNFLRLFSYMWAMKSAGKTDLIDNNIGWLKVVANNTLYEIRPNLWGITNDGDWSGSYVGVVYRNFIYDMAGFLNGTTEGGWLRYLYNNLATPADGVPSSIYAPSAWEVFLFNTGQGGVNYTSALPTYYYSSGDQHTITRTDWTTSAVQTMFNGGTDIFSPSDHQSRSAGHVDITRGSDPLIIMAGQWAGPDGVTGTPQSFDKANWHQPLRASLRLISSARNQRPPCNGSTAAKAGRLRIEAVTQNVDSRTSPGAGQLNTVDHCISRARAACGPRRPSRVS